MTQAVATTENASVHEDAQADVDLTSWPTGAGALFRTQMNTDFLALKPWFSLG